LEYAAMSCSAAVKAAFGHRGREMKL
jgi:hypothetical protein